MVTRALALAVCAPNSNMNRVAYEEFVVRPFRELQQIFDRIIEEQRDPDLDESERALELLEAVLKGKGSSTDEINWRLGQLKHVSDLVSCLYECQKS